MPNLKPYRTKRLANSPMVTIRDVARAAQVSVATVSAVVNDSAFVSTELRQRVEKAIATLRYAPSRASGATNRSSR